MKLIFTAYLLVLVYLIQIPNISGSYDTPVSHLKEYKLTEESGEHSITEETVENLFNKQLEKILKEGPKNRFFNLLTNPDGKIFRVELINFTITFFSSISQAPKESNQKS